METPLNNDFPFTIENWDSAKITEFMMYLDRSDEEMTKLTSNPVSVGPKRYTFPAMYKEEASRIYNMAIKSTDTVVATLPRSGTTWTQEIVWLIRNDLDFSKARSVPLMARYTVMGTTILSKNYEKTTKMSTMDHLIASPDPRFIKTHMPLSLLSPTLLDTAKVVYMARDPRDVAVSEYFFLKLMKVLKPDTDFKDFWRFFMKGYILWQPYFEHVKEAWEARHHPNMLFLFYEDMIRDFPKTLQRMAKFFNKDYTKEQIDELCEYVSFENFKNNQSINVDFDSSVATAASAENSFIRKGKVGTWRHYFDEEMSAQAQRWIQENLQHTDLRYPSMENEATLN